MPEDSDNNNHHSYDYYDDPLYLSSSNQPYSQLVSSLFDGTDFLGWKQDVLMALASKNKDCFVDGTLPQPPKTDKKYHQWVCCDLMVMKWILNFLDKSIRDNLKYVNKLKNFWDTLDSLDPIPQCSCGKISLCTCTPMKRVVAGENNSKLIQFLMGLNNGYDQVVESVDVFTESSVYAAYKPPESHQADKKSKKHCSNCDMNNHSLKECFWVNGCAYCEKPGHKIDKCYRLVGFPSDKSNKPADKYPKAKPKSYDGKKSFKKTANNVDVIEEAPPVADNPLAGSQGITVDPGVMNGLVSSVVDQVLNRLNEFSCILLLSHANAVHSSLMLHDWIIDTGASDHMTFNFFLMHNVRILPKPLSIGLPDGTVKYVTKIGDVSLTDNIVLLSVLFLPDFRQNLLSVTKLIDNNNLCAMFSASACEFQDLSTKNIIAYGRRVGDLYRFQNF
ncbi:uncharacterized protein LOC141600551 [Silene latifolia]|uniref:uncharacterized protein LOC141600551 n=1 Tax=Silene latifolia TaxID=37657 RepID=UPI003D77EEC2